MVGATSYRPGSSEGTTSFVLDLILGTWYTPYRRCQGMPTPAGRGPRRVLGGQDGSMWVRAGSQEGWACEGSMVVVLRGGPGSRFACQTVRLSDCQGLDSLDSGRAWSLSRSLDRALTLCQGSVKPLSIDIAVKPVKTVRQSVDRLSNCQARAQAARRRGS